MVGTKTEMIRLINESGILNKKIKNLDNISFAQIIQAIHKVQDKLGITGTTAKEADSTIQGSANSMKAAWNNLLVAIADDNQDMSESVDKFVDTTITAANNLVPRIKIVTGGIKNLINSVIKEVFPKIKKEIPELKPLVETFEWFIDNKTLVVSSVKTIATAFAINKIVSFSKNISDGAKGILDFAKQANLATGALQLNSTATATNSAVQVAATTTTNGLKTAVNMLNAAWKANPIGMVVAGLTSAIGVFTLLKSKTNEATESQREQTRAIEEQLEKAKDGKDAWNKLVEAQQNQINVGMTEINHLQSLYDELNNITDANGKVKKGYEDRASFILSTLNEALGTEYKMTGNVIDQYKKLTSSIDKVMEKKKAQIMLESQESLYTEAINNQTQATKDLIEAEKQLQVRQEGRKSLEKELEDAQNRLNTAREYGVQHSIISAKSEVEAIEKKLSKYDEETAKVQETYDIRDDTVKKYAYNKGLYEKNMALEQKGEYEKMSTVTWDLVKDYQKAGDAEKKQLEDQIETTKKTLEILKDLKEKSGSDIYDQQIKDSEKQLKENEKTLKQYTETTDKNLSQVNLLWSDSLDKQISAITGSKVEFKDAGKGLIQVYVDGVKAGKPKAKDEVLKLVNESLQQVKNQKADFKTAGKNLIEGLTNGIKSGQGSAYSAIASFGTSLLANLKSSLKEHSPSKATEEMGINLLAGLEVGFGKEKNSVLNQANSFGKSVISSLNSGLAESVKLSAISDIKKNIPSRYNSNNTSSSIVTGIDQKNSNLVAAFKEALKQVKIEMNDEIMGEFVEDTVTKAIYT